MDFLVVIQEIFPQLIEISLDPNKTDEQKEEEIQEIATEKLSEFFGPEWAETGAGGVGGVGGAPRRDARYPGTL